MQRRTKVVGLVGAFALLAGCGAGDTTSGSTDEWDLQAALPASHWWAQMHSVFADELSAGDDMPNVTVHTSGGLGVPPEDALEYVSTGRQDLIEVCTCYTEGTWPGAALFDQQMLFPTFESAVEGWNLIKEDFDEELQERFNSKLLYGGPSDAQMIFTTSQIESLDDFRGNVIRTSAQAQTDLVNVIPGASGTVISAADTYSALERGTIDGTVTGSATNVSNSWYEVTDYGLTAPVNFSLIYVAINLDTYEGLSEEQRSALHDAAEVAEQEWNDTGPRVQEEALETMEAEGMEILPPTPELIGSLQEVAQPQWESWAQRAGEPAEAWLDAIISEGLTEGFETE